MQALQNAEPSHTRPSSPPDRDGAEPRSAAPPATTFTPLGVFWTVGLSTMALSWAMLLSVQRSIANALGTWGMMVLPPRPPNPGSGRQDASDDVASTFDVPPVKVARVGHVARVRSADERSRTVKTGRGTRTGKRTKSGAPGRRPRAA